MLNVFGSYMFPIDPWRKHNKRKDAKWKNNRAFNNWFVYLTNLYMNAFEFKGLPETVNERFLFETLYWDGKALFFNDQSLGYLALPCEGDGELNVYWEFTRFRAISNCYNKVYDYPDDCVLVRANQVTYPPLFMVESWASRIADAERTIDVYAKTMKRPWLITGEHDDKLTMQVLVDEVEQNEVVVTGANRISGELQRAYQNPMDGPGLMALWRHKHELLDECLTWFGINNANTEKRERLITDEVQSNNQLIQLNKDTVLDWLKKACDDINNLYGLSVSVDLKHDYLKEQQELDMKQQQTMDKQQGGGKDG